MNRWWTGVLVGVVASLAGASVGPHPGFDARSYKQFLLGRGRLADDQGIFSSYVAAQVSDNGRFNFGAFPAGAAADTEQSFNLSFAWPGSPGTSFTTLRIDGEDFIFGSSDGQMVQPPVNEGDTSTTIWEADGVRVTQVLSLVLGPTSGRLDTVRIGYRIENVGTATRTVGLRIMIDTMLAGNDAAAFSVPGVGSVTTEQLFTGPDVPSFWQAFASLEQPEIAAQGTLTGPGTFTPDQFAIANWGNINSSLFDFTPTAGEPTGDSAIGIWWLPKAIDPGQARDVATLYGLGSQTVASGALLVGIVAPTQVDLPDHPTLTVNLTAENPGTNTIPQVAATLEAPLGFQVAPSVALPLGDVGPGQRVQASWELTVPADARGGYEFAVVVASADPQYVPVRLTRSLEVIGPPLPPTGVVDPARSEIRLLGQSDPTHGQVPVDGGAGVQIIARDAQGQPVGNVPPESIRVFVEPSEAMEIFGPEEPTGSDGSTIVVVVGHVATEVQIRAEINGSPIPGSVRVRYVDVGDIRAVAIYMLEPGLHLLANPLETAIEGDSRGIDVVTWDAESQRYVPVESMGSLRPDQGAFVRVHEPVEFFIAGRLPGYPDIEWIELSTSGASSPVGAVGRFDAPAPDQDGVLELKGEWNLVGNPFPTELTWNLSNLQVVVDGQPVGLLADPATWRYVDPYLFTFNGTSYELVFDPGLPGFEQAGRVVPLLQGAWIRRTPGTQAVGLRLLEQPAAPITPPDGVAARSGRAGGWAVGLTARAGGETATVTFGMAQRALAMQVPPPIAPASLELNLLQAGSRLAGELRSGSPLQRWTASVSAPRGEAVTLDWASLGRALPAGLSAVLTDLQTGRRISMRSKSAYGYTSQGETRQFAIEVARQTGERLRATLGATPTRSRGATLTLNLNVPATVRLEVTSLAGRPVRSLVQQAAASGLTAFTWDGRDNQGRPVPAGTYQVVVTAESDQGEMARATTQVTVR